MRQSKSLILIEQHDGWYLQEVSSQRELLCGLDAEPAELAEHVISAGERLAGKHARLAILLSSTSVLHAAFPLSETGGSRARATLSFRLEAKLPLSAEDTLSAFQVSGGATNPDTTVVALATEKRRLIDLVGELYQAGMQVSTVVSSSVIVVQHLVERGLVPSSCYLVLLDEPHIELLLVDKQRLLAWRVVHDLASAERDLRMLRTERPELSHVCLAGTKSSISAWPDQTVGDDERIDLEFDAVRIERSAAILNKKVVPWFDFVNDPAMQSVVNTSNWNRFAKIAALASLCFLVVAGACLWRTYRVRAVASSIRNDLRDVYSEVFPGQKIPATVVARLKSERTKVSGSRSAGANQVPVPQPAIPVLQRLLLALPDTLEFSIIEIRIENGDLYLDLEVIEHRDAGLIAQALQTEGISVLPPTTEVSGERVRAQLRGVVRNEREGRGGSPQG